MRRERRDSLPTKQGKDPSSRARRRKRGSPGCVRDPGASSRVETGMVARPWSSSRLSCGERLLLRCDGNAGNSLPTKQGKDPSSRARRRKRGSPGCVRDPGASSRVETGMVARPWSSSRLSCGERLLLRCDGNAGNSLPTKQGKDPSSRARRRKRGSPGCVRDPGASSRVETGLSHVHTWWESILGLNVKAVQGNRFLWNGLKHLRDSWNGGTTLEFLSPFLWRAPPLEMRRERRDSLPTKQGKDPSSRASRQKRGSPGCVRDPGASSRVETGLSHVYTWWESILGLNVKAVQGKQVPLEWTETSAGLLEWWHDPGVPLAFPVESASS
ncbi:hypothetical protein MJG53_000125 [Ovis ammon polii x Ovis aries]|nr:hypothetical protein MJG53_000125 [Ovis ammon polii x Ovis aries]